MALRTQYWQPVELKKRTLHQVCNLVGSYLCRLEQLGNCERLMVCIDARVKFSAGLRDRGMPA